LLGSLRHLEWVSELKVIVVFDVPVECDWLRTEIRELLKDYGGIFLQYSVYELDLPEKILDRLLEKLEQKLKKCGGRIDIVKPCSRCLKKILVVDTTRL